MCTYYPQEPLLVVHSCSNHENLPKRIEIRTRRAASGAPINAAKDARTPGVGLVTSMIDEQIIYSKFSIWSKQLLRRRKEHAREWL